jgi:hypothetical protein
MDESSNKDILHKEIESERSEIPRDGSSDRYDLEYNKKLYPHKYIISLANKYANGKELDNSQFTGGPPGSAIFYAKLSLIPELTELKARKCSWL